LEIVVPRAQLITLLLVFVAASPVAAIAIWSISHTVIEFSDPCASWDYPPEQPVYMHVGPHDACREPSIHTESKARAAIRAAIVPGGVLLSAILAVAGAALLRRRLVIAAGVGMLAETLAVFTIAPLTLVVGVSFLLLSRRLRLSS
jgi:hypothetical protein